MRHVYSFALETYILANSRARQDQLMRGCQSTPLIFLPQHVYTPPSANRLFSPQRVIRFEIPGACGISLAAILTRESPVVWDKEYMETLSASSTKVMCRCNVSAGSIMNTEGN